MRTSSSSSLLVITFTLLLTTLSSTCGKQSWNHLSSTYALIPIHGFHELPRTSLDAFKQNWIKIGSCQDDSSFLGERYIRDLKNHDIVLIFDINGYIAGIQNVISSNLPTNEFVNMEEDPYYQREKILNQTEAYFTTAYFIEPNRICTKGRTREEFKMNGTGYTLIFQKGPNAKEDKYLMKVPLFEKDMSEMSGWYEHGCWFNMGKHYAQFNHKKNQKCTQLFPGHLIFNDSKLHGFAWQHYGRLNGRRYEHPHNFILERIVKKGPRCLFKGKKDLGISSMHIYFKSHMLMCP